eukprot:GGOE01011248.1.p5 GENE.GGOE01011248.1~~GGOE01011248.1.p5  ORF type:complete len:107 (-),score=1.47 GGOE01011248.1:335-655(-)
MTGAGAERKPHGCTPLAEALPAARIPEHSIRPEGERVSAERAPRSASLPPLHTWLQQVVLAGQFKQLTSGELQEGPRLHYISCPSAPCLRPGCLRLALVRLHIVGL